jgi:hypothetical protein
MSSTTRIITIALAILALAAPVAGASPIRDGSPPISPPHSTPLIDTPPGKDAQPVVKTQPAPAADNDPSPLVYVLAGVTLVGVVAATTAYLRSSRPRQTAQA